MQEAYDVLGDADKRGKYDRYGDQWKAYSQAEAQGGFPGSGGSGMGGGHPGGVRVEYSGDPSQFGDMNDLFASLFGDGRGGGMGAGRGRGGASPFVNMRQAAPQRGQDTEAMVSVTLEEAYSGVTKTLALSGEPRYDVSGGASVKDGARRTVEVKIPAGVGEIGRAHV